MKIVHLYGARAIAQQLREDSGHPAQTPEKSPLSAVPDLAVYDAATTTLAVSLADF